MLVFAIDDEAILLETLHSAIAAALPGAEIRDFLRGNDALSAITERGARPQLVFSDIRMPDMDGLHLATAIKACLPDTRIIFTTAYSEYALEAWKRHVHGYLMKPVTAEDILETLDALPQAARPKGDRLTVRCFGNFDVLWQGKPLPFARSKTKELLAYLIDQEGAFCTAGEIISALWEEGEEGKDAKTYLRVLTNDLTTTLREIGMAELLLKRRGQWAVDCDKLDCDYYRMRDGDVEALNAYRGKYMAQYSWAELTTAQLQFRDGK